jgi:hypothetical protein
MAQLAKGAETSISMSFLVMCAEKILRLHRLFLSLFLIGFTHGRGLHPHGWCLNTFGGLLQANF